MFLIQEADPTRFYEPYNHPNPKHRAGWRGGIKKEFRDMKAKEVWNIVKLTDVPNDRSIIGCK